LDRARNLFEFLREAQRLRAKPVRSVQDYQRVIWLADLPDHDAVVSAHRLTERLSDELIFWVDRVPREEPPAPSDALAPWLSGSIHDPDQPPELRAEVPAEKVPHLKPRPSDYGPEPVVRQEEHPAVAREFQVWLDRWTVWAEVERERRVIREIYGSLFQIYDAVTNQAEEFELVLGVGCLSWDPPEYPKVQRHLFVAPVAIYMDDETGRLTVTSDANAEPLALELDMLDPDLLRNPIHVNAVKAEIVDFDGNPLERDAVAALTRRVINALHADGTYVDEDKPMPAGSEPVGAFAPALILRRRSQRGMLSIFDTICSQLAAADTVPIGILPLVDPDYQVRHEPDPTPGGVVDVDGEAFLALPVNERQLKIIKSVDTRAQTVVQGPPGTGKTHTAAALLSHLLAQGKRVLVTAHTDRALHEVREKLPEDIKPLTVAVVGASRSDMADLRLAVERIASEAAEHNEQACARQIEATLQSIDELRRERAATYQRLLHAREHEVAVHQRGRYTGTLAQIAQRHQADAERFGWISGYVEVESTAAAPLTDAEALEWLALVGDEDLARDEPESSARLVEIESLPDPDTFAEWCAAERTAEQNARTYERLRSHDAFAQVHRLDPNARADVQKVVNALADDVLAFEGRGEGWMRDALADVRAGRAGTWQARARQLRRLIDQASVLVDRVGPVTTVEISGGEMGALVALAKHLREHLASGARIRTLPDGRPKLDLFTARAVKQAALFFDHVRVNGLPPVTDEQLAVFLAYVEAEQILGALDKAWPAAVVIPDEDTLHERLQWHVTETEQLERLLAFGEALRDAETRLTELGVNPPAWTDLAAVREYARLVDAAAAVDALENARRPLNDLAEELSGTAAWNDAGACVHRLVLAVRQRDRDEYAAAYARLRRLIEVRSLVKRRRELDERLAVVPRLRVAATATASDPEWPARLAAFTEAWAWATTGAWIREQESVDVNALQERITAIEARIRRQVERLAALRAWSHAVSPKRLTPQTRADLIQYAQLVRRLGKGTGKYADLQRAEIRRVMDRCRGSVPVWIMPIYRIAEQFRIKENMFDVVIVDEASQAGVEASFLQYLAPKIVVIGDDKQVSPSAVGVDQQQLRRLANQYLANDRYKESWQDPKRSLFDEALMRYGGRITLVEHRRCVPEIIGFSNQIAYEPEGVRLLPVRQYGADRLDPIKVVHVEDGYVKELRGAQVNPAEVDAIVAQIEKCLADPRYDGLTFGVISLLGTAQARAIEARLLERIPPEEWKARALRCGDAADFQGSERDVIFLSMVAALTPGKRLAALTMDTYLQRYNVAASRAKDQMWVFHSVPVSALGNRDDMRFRLLDYCYGVVSRLAAEDDTIVKNPVPEDVRVDPFDSLFEQRVFNRLLDRGYSVIPQFPTEGYRIDLVVVGAKGRLAIECDGDQWHGPEAYQRDLARQRDLERCGWRFFRIRESAFYLDPAAVLNDLWSTLDSLEIRPGGSAIAPDRGQGELSLRTAPPRVFPAPTISDRSIEDDGDDQAVDAGNETWPEDGDKALDLEPEPSPPTRAASVSADLQEDDLQEEDLEGDESAEHEIEEYEAFTGRVADPLSASREEVVNGLRAIVAVEGPVLGSWLRSVYLKAAQRQRMGKEIARTLNDAIRLAVRRGQLVTDPSEGRKLIEDRTYRLPDQPPVRLRALGPRPIDQVPPQELAALLRDTADRVGWDDREALFRAAINRLGLRRLTTSVVRVLETALALARQEPDRRTNRRAQNPVAGSSR
jgi:very-short-patch-repair endonuclease